MNNLFYSTEALNVKSKFNNKKYSLFVEGKEDKKFWCKIFKRAGIEDIYIDQTGGYNNLIVHIHQVIQDDAKVIVACDRDHAPFKLTDPYKHPRIISTYGYSIENTKYCYVNIHEIIENYTKKRFFEKNTILEWLNTFSNSAKRLLIYDIANHRYSKGKTVFGNKCIPFLVNKESDTLSDENISAFIENIKKNFTTKEINCVENLVKNDKREIKYLIKGHFLTNGVLNFINNTIKKETGEKASVSINTLYSLTVSCSSLCKNICEDIKFLFAEISNAMNSLNKTSI